MRFWHRLRLAANAANGSTLLGLVVARAGRAALRPAGDGLLVASGYRPPVPPAPAFCVGNVLVTRLDHAAITGNARLFAHEARHATQYAYCGGLTVLPAYAIAAGLSWVLSGDVASANVFEQQAGLADGGYTRRNLRPLLRRARARCAQLTARAGNSSMAPSGTLPCPRWRFWGR